MVTRKRHRVPTRTHAHTPSRTKEGREGGGVGARHTVHGPQRTQLARCATRTGQTDARCRSGPRSRPRRRRCRRRRRSSCSRSRSRRPCWSNTLFSSSVSAPPSRLVKGHHEALVVLAVRHAHDTYAQTCPRSDGHDACRHREGVGPPKTPVGDLLFPCLAKHIDRSHRAPVLSAVISPFPSPLLAPL